MGGGGAVTASLVIMDLGSDVLATQELSCFFVSTSNMRPHLLFRDSLKQSYFLTVKITSLQ